MDGTQTDTDKHGPTQTDTDRCGQTEADREPQAKSRAGVPTLPLDLDWILEEKKPVGQVRFAGEVYDLLSIDVMEDLLRFAAVCEKAQATFARALGEDENVEETPENVARISSVVEGIKSELRQMIRCLAPGMSDEMLKEKCPRVRQLQQLFSGLVMEVQRHMPDSLKKNSEAT